MRLRNKKKKAVVVLRPNVKLVKIPVGTIIQEGRQHWGAQ